MTDVSSEFLVVPGMTHDLGGGFIIRRLLPFRKKRMVGPFTFLDHMGPVEYVPSAQTDIRPHPHIGLCTMTYLYEGRMVHRDNIGQVQTILPGEVNWMTAGRGIAHSERAHADDYGKKIRMQGLQFWVALPDGKEEIEPSFAHYSEAQIPIYTGSGFRAKVITGTHFDLTSPVEASSPMLFMDLVTQEACEINLNPAQKNFELAFYVLSGSVTHRGKTIQAGEIAILNDLSDLKLAAQSNSHFIVIGGEPFQTPRFIWWNFVSSSRELISKAKKDWKEERFALIPGDDQERIPLGD